MQCPTCGLIIRLPAVVPETLKRFFARSVN